MYRTKEVEEVDDCFRFAGARSLVAPLMIVFHIIDILAIHAIFATYDELVGVKQSCDRTVPDRCRNEVVTHVRQMLVDLETLESWKGRWAELHEPHSDL